MLQEVWQQAGARVAHLVSAHRHGAGADHHLAQPTLPLAITIALGTLSPLLNAGADRHYLNGVLSLAALLLEDLEH